MRVLVLSLILWTTLAYSHQWSANDCEVAGNDAGVIVADRDAGVSEMHEKEKLLYILHRPKDTGLYQDAEDLYIALAIVDYVYANPTLNFATAQERITTACKKGLNRV
jgi:hypothetical protein